MIENELKDAVDENVDAESLISRLFNVESTFPTTLDEILTKFKTRGKHEGFPRYTGAVWTGAPQLNMPSREGGWEAQLSDWLNCIADDIAPAQGRERKSSCRKMTTPCLLHDRLSESLFVGACSK